MRPIPWVCAALLVLAFQLHPQSIIVSAQTGQVLLPHAVQGNGATSPLAGSVVTVRGVITANAADAFFIQTEAGLADFDDGTSEGLFVPGQTMFGVSTVVELTGTVQELDAAGGTVTSLVDVTQFNVVGIAPVLPDPVALTDAELSPDGALDQLERFEGMRVMAAALSSVSGIGIDGTFFAVLDTAPRPFRGPGIDVGSPLACAVGPCQFETYNGNPERLRVDSDALAGTMAPWLLTAGAQMTDVVGPLHFEAGAYTLLAESTLTPTGGVEIGEVPAAAAGQYSIASLTLGPPAFDDVDLQATKASLLVRTALNLPDVIAVQQAGGNAEYLAQRIDGDAIAAGQPAPGYTAYLDAFLVKSSRVTDVTAETVGSAEQFQNNPLFDRAPVLLRGVVNGGADDVPQPLTLLNSELRSAADVERDDDTGVGARAHRQAQAEWLASFVNGRQANDPGERLVSLGNFNAHAFNDGYVDVMGTVSGTPAPPDQVVVASPDLLSPDLVNLVGRLDAAERYSSVVRGIAQSFNHTLVSANLAPLVRDFRFARVAADFPEVLQFFDDTAVGVSDRDPTVAYFAFPSDVTPPTFDAAPQDEQAEAAGPSGATVTFNAPTATDAVDGPVGVTCAPASGSMFPLGSTRVRCWSQDVAGNRAEVFFAVTVEDTTPPVFTSAPADIEVPATGPNGAVVRYTLPAATDAVDSAVEVVCEPASGSVFQVGNTAVACTAVDDEGNAAVTGFTVAVTAADSLPGHITGNGELLAQTRVNFVFNVKETKTHIDRGWVVVHVETRKGKNDRYLVGVVTDAVFTNSPDYSAGPGPLNGVDTVVFSGVGCWNGKGGHTFEITATDRGEPGRGRDTFSVVVKRNGVVVESATGTLHRGNIQSRRR